mmetsp:Transcript_19859/g.41077  ORF Transcript_19859/g.41077 Transcript_19859/m.41077 type:complete len:168 (+) Transcript_19859:329-832(+)
MDPAPPAPPVEAPQAAAGRGPHEDGTERNPGPPGDDDEDPAGAADPDNEDLAQDPPPLPQPDAGADLPDYDLTAANTLLDSLYRDHMHSNPGTHLSGNIEDNPDWQRRWHRMVQLPPHCYLVLQGRVGKAFLQGLSNKFLGVRLRQWNSKKPLVFVAVILQVAYGVK